MTPTETRLAAKHATAAEKWSEAASLWDSVYQDEQNWANNYQLVTALVADKQFLAASTIAAEFEENYLQTDEAAALYLTALLESHLFIPAHMVAVARQSSPWAATAHQRVQSAETQAEATLGATLKTTMRQFYHLSDQPVTAQIVGIRSAQHLTYAKYLTAAKFLLVDPFLHQLSRIEVLDTLRAMGVTEEVTMQSLNEQSLTICPATLPVMGSDPTSIAAQQTLKALIGNDNSTLYTNLEALLTLQLMYLYPQTEDLVTDVHTWVTVFVQLQTGQLSENDAAQFAAVVALQQKIQAMNLDLQK